MYSKYKKLSNGLRAHVLRMTHRLRSSHIGSCFSMIDFLSVLYLDVLNVDPAQPNLPERDRFILSKGHAGAAVYAVLAEKGFFPVEMLDTYYGDGSLLAGHIMHHVAGVEASTGALGHGLGLGCGMALVGKRDSKKYRVFVVISDGECDEGSTWEAALLASHHKLDNLTVIVDYNKFQSLGRPEEILNLEPLAEKWRSFGWGIQEINGHDFEEITNVFAKIPFDLNKPTCIIAHTIKGKGVSFMEDQLIWHYYSPDKDELITALSELEEKN